jgi:hypothetical protein
MRSIVRNLVFLGLFVSTVAGAALEPLGKEEVRTLVMSRGSGPDVIGPQPGDYARDLVDSFKLSNLAQMESLKRATLPISPWTDSYWPTYAGGIANRYGDVRYRPGYRWSENQSYLRNALGKGESAQLSPAEKYDLLVGDKDFTLTRGMWSGAAAAAGADGIVEGWFGLCHGWAAASFMLPRPVKSLRVKAANGRELTFTPSDIKALGTLLWANAPARTRFVGGRCNEKMPGRDDNGREKDPECFDNNPATWHLAVVNQIGVSKRSFVFDMEEGHEVWNQPVYSYEFTYQNPATHVLADTLAEGKVALNGFDDPYRHSRSPLAVSVVGIDMRVTYISETQATLAPTDAPENDQRTTIQLSYQLELDARDEIVGGEWTSSNHPDFMWLPAKGARASSVGDDWLWRTGDRSEWRRGDLVPASWLPAAKGSAQRQQPLARIVEALFDEASRP